MYCIKPNYINYFMYLLFSKSGNGSRELIMIMLSKNSYMMKSCIFFCLYLFLFLCLNLPFFRWYFASLLLFLYLPLLLISLFISFDSFFLSPHFSLSLSLFPFFQSNPPYPNISLSLPSFLPFSPSLCYLPSLPPFLFFIMKLTHNEDLYID